jgi:hypothetical protein
VNWIERTSDSKHNGRLDLCAYADKNNLSLSEVVTRAITEFVGAAVAMSGGDARYLAMLLCPKEVHRNYGSAGLMQFGK